MEQKYRKFYVEWWRIRKSTIYGSIAILIFAGVTAGGVWYASKNNWFLPDETSNAPKDAARIISFEGDVRIVRASTRETIVVTKETYVSAGDTVQTQANGKAKVQMIDGSELTIRPNSTVVIRDNSSLFGGNNVRVSLDDGQLNVRTQDQPDNSENIVEMSESETRLKSQTEASFNASAENRNGEIRISRGSVETTVGGSKQTIKENEFASVSSGKIANKEQLLPAPRLSSPDNSGQIVDVTGSGAGVSFNWQSDAQGLVAAYHFQLARLSNFGSDSLLVDRGSLGTREFRVNGVTPGTYYWRVSGLTRTGQISEWCEPWKFNVTRRDAARKIDASEWKVDRVGGNVFLVSGRTLPGAVVKSLGRETFAGSDGSFRIQVSTPLSEVAFEMADDQGNRAGFVLSLRSGKEVRRF
ncbi:MAG: FecR domain-containing protein [Pyrinomonadaceae bacterium]